MNCDAGLRRAAVGMTAGNLGRPDENQPNVCTSLQSRQVSGRVMPPFSPVDNTVSVSNKLWWADCEIRP